MRSVSIILISAALLTGCVAGKGYNPNKKFGREQLDKDYSIFRNVLEEAHPGLYWYTPKDSMDYYFQKGEQMLQDSMTEMKFRNVLTYVVSKIRCGHTSVRPSRAAFNFNSTNFPSFPLFIKAWPDTVVVTANLNRKDSLVRRGVLLEGIDNRNVNKILDSLFQHLSADGYNLTHKYQTVSNGSNFRSMYASLYGLRPRVNVSYIDSAGHFKQSPLAAYNPKADSQRQAFKPPKLSKRERRRIMLNSTRSLKIDTTLNTAVLEVNAFTKDSKLRSFFRQSFKKIRKEQIPNLIVDMRGNGGGSVTLSNLLTKYIASAPFKIADSLYAIKRSSKYGRFRENQLLNWLFLQFLTRKKADGHYHFTFFENKYFKPKTKNHFNGTTYILTGGNTFSAATLFTKALVKQENVIVVGEETGGGAYGNTAWLIPDVTLPNTKVRFRLPLFRLVVDRNEAKGHGVYPEVEVVPTVEDIRKGNDYKMDKVKQLIKQRSTAGY